MHPSFKRLNGMHPSFKRLNNTCAGAHDDLQKVTGLAYTQICQMGMNERVGLVSFPEVDKDKFAGKPYSKLTAKLIDTVCF